MLPTCPCRQVIDLQGYLNQKSDTKSYLPTVCAVHGCPERENLWSCTSCNFVGCGRYANQHALDHYAQTNHATSVQKHTFQVHCYECDNDFDFATPNHALQEEIEEAVTSNVIRWKEIEALGTGTVGLQNLGNTCYLNSTVQILALIKPLRIAVFRIQNQLRAAEAERRSDSSSNRRQTRRSCSLHQDEVCVTSKLGDLFKNLCVPKSNGKRRQSYCPLSFVTAIQNAITSLATFRQQDAQEFLRLFIDRVHWEMVTKKRYSNGILNIFKGQLRSEVTCLECNAVTVKNDSYLDLSLDLPLLRVTLRKNDQQGFTARDMSLRDCLKSFTRLEKLGPHELYYCYNCSSNQQCTKRITIDTLPPYCVLHLKRFGIGRRRRNRSKLRNKVTFPLKNLDMAPFMSSTDNDSTFGSTYYDLIGVVTHHGTSVGCGHYTSYGRCGDTWLHYNDSSVKPVSESVVAAAQAYLLLYKRLE